MLEIAEQAEELNLPITGIDLRKLSGAFGQMATTVDHHIDKIRDPRGARRAGQL